MQSARKHLLQEGALWATLGVCLLAAIYFFDDIRALMGPRDASERVSSGAPERAIRAQQTGFAGEVHLKADPRGHFIFQGEVDGRPVNFMADTGASIVALTFEDARRAGLRPHSLDFNARVQTANGIARVAPITLSRVRVGTIRLHGVKAAVAEKGALRTNLLGMSFLGRLKSFQLAGDELILIR